ncbi:deoxyuridine 5'-triphosphate nucleotidohydrolase, mitochondrial isoform X1 [Lynx canadensis]|uniref:deoxyuridine 5'-triphosphate nucleotidohydrolase, mitochondrial isoform X1 n=1 Tax=Lynx canadensis TaxID=61383 RepID=UPI0011B04DBB|nr:deoxyuridine 5'-triphosphate nucleotidohydrolase, mitochondrial isoform X1 [Lynx canadensis]XP_046931100.1 deoxyuridine 5'-triphosphate nucleotidohydrolase, mitochondrial isoform X1 [Lynx rufus]
MTPVCPRPALGYHFFPCLLRSVFKDARSAAPRAEAAGPPRPLSSTRSLSRGCRGASNVGAQTDRTPLAGSGEAGSPASPPQGRPATPTISPSKRARPAEDAMRLRFVRLSEHATAPSKGSARAAGYDLYSAYDYTVPPMEKVLVKTDIQIALPSGCYGRVAPRSGLAAKHFIDVGAGVIDEDYRGNVGVVLFNFGKEKFEVKKGDRIAQLICERIFYPEIEEVQVLDDTERGSGGFGSTGKN